LSVTEGTLSKESFCFDGYTAHARWTGSEFEISGTMFHPNSDSSGSGCADVGIQGYVVVHLPRPYTGQPVRDMRTGKLWKVGERVYPTPEELVNVPPR